MKTVTIFLDSIDKVKNFVNIIVNHDGDYDLKSDRYVVDAKSIMGVFSLDFSEPLMLNIYDDANYDVIKNDLQDYIV
jgi:phosphotransferase system HPr-like phosphotransfer protein